MATTGHCTTLRLATQPSASISKVSRHSPAGLSSAHTGSHVDQPPRAVLCLLCGHHVHHGSSPVPACATSYAAGDLPFTVSDLPAGTHAVQWSSGVVLSGWQVVCWGVQGTRPSRGSNITIDDSYNGGFGSNGPIKLQYSGTWQHDSGGQGAAGGSFQKTLATTSSQGAQVSFSSSGESLPDCW